MAAIEPLAISPLGPAEAPAGLGLSAEAHWNQNEADWRFFLGQGNVFGVRDQGGQLIATAALLPYASGNAWISMVLVTANWRRRGLATGLVDACLDAAARQSLTSWLDATPAGAAVYGRLGFVATLELRRLRLERPRTPEAATPQPLSGYHLSEFITRDAGAIGFDRSTLLTELAGRPTSRLVSRDDAVTLVRDGRKARHIGPLFAADSNRALALVDTIARSESGPLLIDAVSTQQEFVEGLTGSGWRIERPFQRMRFGGVTAQVAEPPFAVAGPEYG
jgi:GNAT superfamily N-acetyltransferase